MWIGDSLSTMERLCVNSFMHNGHEFHLYVYGEIDNIPMGVVLKDANEIIPSSKIFKDDRDGVASFSDWFRYKLLYDRGGWWVDMDAVCMRYLDIEDDYCFATENVDCATNGFMKSPAKAEFLEDMLGYIDENLNKIVVRGEFGPSLLRRVLAQYDSKEYIQPTDVFCPIYWMDVKRLIEPSSVVFSQKTLTVHLWNEMWRIYNLDKNATYYPDSIYETLKRKYL